MIVTFFINRPYFLKFKLDSNVDAYHEASGHFPFLGRELGFYSALY